MNREDIIKLAREAGLFVHKEVQPEIERFATLVAAAERNRTWTQDHWTEYERSIAAAEREACAKVADDHERQRCEAWAKVLTTGGEVPSTSLSAVAAAIRARGKKK